MAALTLPLCVAVLTSCSGRARRINLFLAALTLPLCAAVLTSCSGPARYQATFYGLFDTVSTITGYASGEDEFSENAQAIYDRLAQLNSYFDIYNSYDGLSNLKTVNDMAGVRPVEVCPEIIGLVEFAARAFSDTGGAVNAALGPALSIWGAYRDAGLADPASAAPPPAEALAEAAKLADMADVVADRNAGTVFLRKKGMSLDAGALAKGYAVQLVTEEIREKGLGAYLLDIGGNVSAIGSPPGRAGWSVGVQDPFDSTKLAGQVYIRDMSAVTSGDYQRFYYAGGKKYCHIIDPATLMPAERYRAVTVLCPDSGVADMLSTALFILPLEDGKALADRFGAGAVWILPDGTAEKNEAYRGFEGLNEE